MKTVVISVTNDINTDQRIYRVANTLYRQGFDVLVVGRKKKNSFPLIPLPYRVHRIKIKFNKGPLFYAEFNLRLFFFLLLKKTTILLSNDLDTLLPNYLISKIKRVPIIFDSHEYYTGVPELKGRNFVRNVWKSIERAILPKLKKVYTVSDSIAIKYLKEYNINASVIKNVPYYSGIVISDMKKKLSIRNDYKIIIYQGALNVERGLEEMIEAMTHLRDNKIVLLLCGTGDIIEKLKEMAIRLNLSDKVIFTGQIPFINLKYYTAIADIGISIERADNENYKCCLPNKLFDYIQARIPILASPLPEIKKIFDKYNIGCLIESHDPAHIADKVKYMLENTNQQKLWKDTLSKAAEEYCWEIEEKEFLKLYSEYVN
ncbi:MAG: glycosyltransferase [Bacteroidota bacterium]|nr:glycosyltransferase [Bacteroidota bacterium]